MAVGPVKRHGADGSIGDWIHDRERGTLAFMPSGTRPLHEGARRVHRVRLGNVGPAHGLRVLARLEDRLGIAFSPRSQQDRSIAQMWKLVWALQEYLLLPSIAGSVSPG
jgi:hypothetical protein